MACRLSLVPSPETHIPMTDKLLQGLEFTVRNAIEEDVGDGDVTASLIPKDKQAVATVVCREAAIICGRPWFDEVFRQLDPDIKIDWQIEESSEQGADTLLCTLTGNARHILTGERTALNFLQTLSGTATTTQRYAKALQGSGTRILDTRKTLPGLRLAQKYAVHCGGGMNHRIGLFDQVLIKENHIMSAGSITAAVEAARQLHPQLKVEVETENLTEVEEALKAGADIIMLDNFSHDDMRTAVQMNNGLAKLEVSGNVTIELLAALAEIGVDYISSGALTKNLQSIDLSMRFQLS